MHRDGTARCSIATNPGPIASLGRWVAALPVLMTGCLLEVQRDRESDTSSIAVQSAPLISNSDHVTETMLARRWPNGVVPYKYDPARGSEDFPVGTGVAIDTNQWRALTNGAVRFVYDPAPEGPHVVFYSDGPRIECDVTSPPACCDLTDPEKGDCNPSPNSTRGKRGYDDVVANEFEVRMWNPWSWTVHHEMGHILGLEHMDLHPLRDNSGNPDDCRLTSTNPLPDEELLAEYLGRYVPNSIMHYRDIDEYVYYRGGSCDVPVVPPCYPSPCPAPCKPVACPPPPQPSMTACPCNEGVWCANALPANSSCQAPVPELPTSHDVAVIRKLYGVNGDWLHDTEWCSFTNQRLYVGDFDGNGASDLLCQDYDDGDRWQRFGSGSSLATPVLSSTNRKAASAFCAGTSRIYIGDFNGDGRDDALCHSPTGLFSIDFANSSGHLNVVDWSTTDVFCSATSRTILVGDFDGDSISDLVCHNRANGNRTIAYGGACDPATMNCTQPLNANNLFDRQYFVATNNWCGVSNRRVIVGKFDGDNQSDLLCQRTDTGTRALDYANNAGVLSGTNWDSPDEPLAEPFCWGSDRTIYAGDANGDGRDDLICHDSRIGRVSTLLSESPLQSNGSKLWEADWDEELGFCNAQDAELKLANFGTAGGSTDLFCYNKATGQQAIRYADNTSVGAY